MKKDWKKPKVIMIVDTELPYGIIVNDEHVVLQDKQFRLICELVKKPGKCIPYETIYKALWGKTIVCDSQISFQKRALAKRIQEADPNGRALICTICKRGLVLDLMPEEVLVLPTAYTLQSTAYSLKRRIGL